MRVLIVEDDADALDLLDNALVRFGYEVTKATDGVEALDLIRSGQFHRVLSDWELPGMSGVELCREVRRRGSGSYVYFMLLTARSGTKSLVEGLRAGADEFLFKPVDPDELEVRLRVADRILSLEGRDVAIFSLAKLAEARDPETGAHLERIREYCRVLAQHLSRTDKYRDVVDGNYVQLLYCTSPLHDIGKVGIPDAVLLKPGRLTPEEFEIMKQHTVIGAETLSAAVEAHPRAAYLRMARDIALSHHEKYDGTGYPLGLSGEAIPLCGRIVALCDVYDALTTARVYKPAYSHEAAKDVILAGKGAHFDPAVVDAFLDNEGRFIEIRERLDGTEEEKDTLRPIAGLQEKTSDGGSRTAI